MTIHSHLVHQLIRAQFPQWADLPVTPVVPGGWDHRTFRVGRELVARLPSAERYAAQVDKEQTWLPRLAEHLPLRIPEPVARGGPQFDYPFEWSVYRWIEGEPATNVTVSDRAEFAHDLAGFLLALQRAPAATGPPAGEHNFHRGGSLAVYDSETREALVNLHGLIDADACAALWERALAGERTDAPVWVHGDVAAGNLLVRDGRLAAVIDFGSSGTGDPACDLTIAWTFFADDDREAFRSAIAADPATWERARGWALWKALVTLAGRPDGAAPGPARGVLDALLTETG